MKTNVLKQGNSVDVSARHDLPSGRTALRNGLWNLLSFGWTLLLALITTAYFVRELGLAQFGVWGLLSLLLTPLGLVNFGFATAAIKFVAEHFAAGEREQARRYAETTYWMAMIVGLGGSLVILTIGTPLMFAAFHLPEIMRDTVQLCVALMAVVWLFQQAGGALAALPAALSRYRRVALGNAIAQTVTAGTQIALVHAGLGLVGVVLGTAIGAALGWLAWVLIVRGLGPVAPSWPRFHRDVWQRCFRFGGWQTVGELGGLLASQAEKFLLGHYLAPSALGVYNAALRAEQAAYTVGFRLSEVLLPYFSARSRQAADSKVSQFLRAAWLITGFSVCALSPLMAFAPELLYVWVGPEVAGEGAIVLSTLALGGMLGAASNAPYFFLVAHARTRTTGLLAIMTGTIVALGAAILLPRFGLAAAAVAGAIAMFIQSAILGAILGRVLDVRIPLASAIASLYAPIAVGVAVALALLAWPLRPETWWQLLLALVTAATLSAVAIVAVGLVTPGRRERRNDLAVLVDELRRLLRARVTA